MTHALSRISFLAVAYGLYGLVRLLNASYRFEYVGLEHRRIAESHSRSSAFALATWHENLFATILSQIGSRYAPLASQSKDGAYVAFVLQRLGFDPVRGSSSRGGKEARAEILRRLGDGVHTAITVDGPKGPRRQVKPGIIDIARLAGVAILPVTVVATRFWILKSWDRFRIPRPFSKIRVRYGAPIFVKADVSRQEFESMQSYLGRQLDEMDD